MKILFTCTLILISFFTCSQNFLTATEIENWQKNRQITFDENYNRISSYLYIINKPEYLNTFNGATYSKDEREKFGIKKNDKPDILQMSIEIKYPNTSSSNSFTIPLLMYNFKDSNSKKTFENYNGKILDNIRSDEITSNIMGAIKVNALISNASVKFWMDIAKISANLGKSATSIALGNLNGVIELKNKLTKYLDDGILSLNKITAGEKQEDYTFFIPLVDFESSQNFDEVITSARLYQVHWSSNSITKTNFFKDLTSNSTINPAGFVNAITEKEIPLVLIVESRSRPKINNIKPEFTLEYKNIIQNEYEGYPQAERPMFKSYYTYFYTALITNNYINNFNSTLNSSNIDWNSLIYAIDYNYNFKSKVREENIKYANYDNSFKERYSAIKSRYDQVEQLINELFRNTSRTVYHERADNIVTALLKPKETISNINILYDEVKTLNFYDDFIKNIISDPSSLKSNDSYQKYLELRNFYENDLNNLLTKELPSDDKISFYDKIISDFPLCNKCKTNSINELQKINNINNQTLRANYLSLSNSQFNDFNECRKLIENSIKEMKSKIDSLDDEFEKNIASKSIIELVNGLNSWKENIDKDAKDANSKDLSLWYISIIESRRKIEIYLEDLKSKKILSEQLSCAINKK